MVLACQRVCSRPYVKHEAISNRKTRSGMVDRPLNRSAKATAIAVSGRFVDMDSCPVRRTGFLLSSSEGGSLHRQAPQNPGFEFKFSPYLRPVGLFGGY